MLVTAPRRSRSLLLGRAGVPLAAALVLLASLALIPLFSSPPEDTTESALDRPRPASLGGVVTPAPRKASTAPAGRSAREVEVPDVKGSSIAAAKRVLREAGLAAETRRAGSDGPPGVVLEQEPGPGDSIRRGSAVVLLVSHQPSIDEVAVPDVVGLRADRAVRLARREGLRVEVRFVRSSERAGVVIAQRPSARESVPRGSPVELSVAKAPLVTNVRVPRVEGMPLAEAKAGLRARGLRWSVDHVPSSRPEGIVLRQSERPGRVVEKGTRVTLEVSAGPQLTAVPDVVGLDVVLARQELEAAGFVVVVTERPTSDPAEDGIVLDQSPVAGARLDEGAEVTVYVGLAG